MKFKNLKEKKMILIAVILAIFSMVKTSHAGGKDKNPASPASWCNLQIPTKSIKYLPARYDFGDIYAFRSQKQQCETDAENLEADSKDSSQYFYCDKVFNRVPMPSDSKVLGDEDGTGYLFMITGKTFSSAELAQARCTQFDSCFAGANDLNSYNELKQLGAAIGCPMPTIQKTGE